jgi:hypothetical protein
MARWTFVLAVLLGGAVSVAHADYLRIIYNLEAAKAVEASQQDPMNPGATPPGGLPTPPGAPTPPPGGKPPGGGLPVPPGTPRPPQTPGGPPAPGNPPPTLPPGLPPILGRLLANPEDDESVIEAGVVVEFGKVDKMLGRDIGAAYDRIYHKWGATALIPALPDIRFEFLSEDGVKIPTVLQRYELQRKVKLKGAKTAEAILQLAEWTLNHADIADPERRMFKQFESLMKELRELDPKHPTIVAFDKIEAALDAPVTAGDDTAIIWKDRLDNYKPKRSGHYTLLYDSPSGVPDEADAILEQLNANMRGFYYWFALKGHALPVPERRLVAVLVGKPDEFQSYRDAFDRARVVADGFYSRRENLAVFCSIRQDEVYNVLRQNTNSLWMTGWNAKDLLKGKAYAGAKSSMENVRNQMLALLLKAMGEESVRASVGQDGTRQLLVATGLLTTTVEAPEWIQFGMGSFFETPVGAYWPGIGAPHWTYMVKFKLWKQEDERAEAAFEAAIAERKPPVPFIRKLDPASDAIVKVITDQYFREARQNERKKSLEAKARTMSWSLAYFLMNKKLDMLNRYFEELRNLPRDMVPDDETLTRCFGRAFELMEPADPTRVDTRLLNKLADEWYSFIDLTPMESSEALQEAWRNLKAVHDKAKVRATPGSATLTTPGDGKKPGSGNNPPRPPAPGNTPPGGKPPGGG